MTSLPWTDNSKEREKGKRQRDKQINRQNKCRYKERIRERMEGKHKEERTEGLFLSLSSCHWHPDSHLDDVPFRGQSGRSMKLTTHIGKMSKFTMHVESLYSLRNMGGFTLTLRAPCQARIYPARVLKRLLFWLVLGRCLVRILVEMPTAMTDIFCSFRRALQADAGMVPQVSQRKLLSTSCTIHYIVH
jgi:hypothetical protein